MATPRPVLDWLLDSDPALRWQVERDLLGAPPEAWEATRARVATEGFGARLLAEQDADGQWAGGAYFPAGYFGSAEAEAPGQPWVATTWVLKDLREWGVDAAALEGTAEKLAANSRWEYDDLPYWGGEVDVCINSYTLASGAWLGADVSRLVDWFPAHRLADGGWNCEAEEGDSVRSSFHSTLNAVRGMLAYERITGDTSMREARHGGEEYLLSRRLMFRASTGEPVGDFVTRFVYPEPAPLQRARRSRPLPRRRAVRRHAARSAARRGDRGRARGPTARRQVAADHAAPGSYLVRRRCRRGRAFALADADRHARAGVVGRLGGGR